MFSLWNWEHFWWGYPLYLGARLAGLTPVQAVAYVISVIIAHEIGDGDFVPPKGSMNKAAWEVASALPLPFLCLVLESLQ